MPPESIPDQQSLIPRSFGFRDSELSVRPLDLLDAADLTDPIRVDDLDDRADLPWE
jgi:hypothetical protein